VLVNVIRGSGVRTAAFWHGRGIGGPVAVGGQPTGEPVADTPGRPGVLLLWPAPYGHLRRWRN